MIHEAVILGAGNAVGFYPDSNSKSKTFVSVLGKPLLFWQLDLLSHYGVDRVVLTLQEKHSKSADEELAHGVPHPVDLRIVVDKEPPGSAGSVYSALKHLEGESFFCLNCDDITDINLDKLGVLKAPAISIAPYRLRFGVVETSGGRVTSFAEKPVLATLVNCGCYLFPRSWPFPKRGSIEEDVLPEMVKSGKLSFYEHSGTWWTINGWRDIKEVEERLTRLTYHE